VADDLVLSGGEEVDQVLVLADPLDALFGGVGDLSQRGRGPVRQLDILEIRPQALHRVQLGA
jgi:hypothetical protein